MEKNENESFNYKLDGLVQCFCLASEKCQTLKENEEGVCFSSSSAICFLYFFLLFIFCLAEREKSVKVKPFNYWFFRFTVHCKIFPR